MHCVQCRVILRSVTSQERNLLLYVAQGMTNSEIGRRMGLKEKTIKNYLSQLFAKTGVGNRVGLVTFAFKHHLVELDEV
jgi:DNA-binding NarL/FixJ family response regulator